MTTHHNRFNRSICAGPDIFMRPDTILTYLQDRGFIPDEILPAMNVSPGMTNKICILVYFYTIHNM